MLALDTVVPDRFKKLTSGLLGNYDDNPENDFIKPTGEVLPGNMTEREIFAYGLTCRLYYKRYALCTVL